MVFLSGITFAFIEAPSLGWSSPAVLTMAVLGVIGLAAFLTWERHAASPMLPLAIFAQRQFHARAIGSIRGACCADRAPPAAEHRLPSGGAGLALLTLAPTGPSYVLYVLPAVVVFGLGLAITVAPLTANSDVARFGGLLAVAILPALAGITGQPAGIESPPLPGIFTVSRHHHVLAISPRG
jgi:hypothetical protein